MQTLTKVEEEIMVHIWELGRCVVRDLLDRLGDESIPHSTVSSVVRILEKKGFVDHKAYGKTHEYFPLISREDYAAQGVDGLVDRYFSGSAGQLVSFLVQRENLSKKDVSQILDLLGKAKKK
ncbi:MAG: BlaI/MecI/CopY family transcriptional regulator [Sphingobacteriales bacterium]|nr:MAG: BlaI/MecI/CopY family transcriptional regulator [Sphingobacteriales bacterium]